MITQEEFNNKSCFEYNYDSEQKLFRINIYKQLTQEEGVKLWKGLRANGIIDVEAKRFIFVFYKEDYQFDPQKRYLMREYYDANEDFFRGKIVAVVNNSTRLSAAVTVTSSDLSYMKLAIFSTVEGAYRWVLGL